MFATTTPPHHRPLAAFSTLALALAAPLGCGGDAPADEHAASGAGGTRDQDGTGATSGSGGGAGTGGESGGATPSGAAPEIHFDGPLAPVPASDTAARLHWTALHAQTCYGIAAPDGVAGWTREWPASTTAADGFLVGDLPRHPTDPTSYDFTLRCYGESDAIGGEPVVAYRDKTHTVTLEPATAGGGSSCDAYLATLSPSERATFDAYRAEGGC